MKLFSDLLLESYFGISNVFVLCMLYYLVSLFLYANGFSLDVYSSVYSIRKYWDICTSTNSWIPAFLRSEHKA